MEVKEFFYDKEAIKKHGTPEFKRPKKKILKPLAETISNFESEIIEMPKPKRKQKQKEDPEISGLIEKMNSYLDGDSKRFISSSKKQTIEAIRGGGIRLPEETCNIEDFDMKSVSFTGAVLDYACVEGVEVEIKYFFGVITYIYEFLEDISTIKINTIMNIKEGEEKGKGFRYLEELNISIQGVTSDRAIKEIFAQVLGNDIEFEMRITTKEKKFILTNNI